MNLISACDITTGKLDSNAAVADGKYLFFTCAPEPLKIDSYAFEGDMILLAGNNASGNFHCQRFKGKCNVYQRTYVITAKKGFDIDFLYFNLLVNLNILRKHAHGSQTKFLTMEILNNFEILDVKYEEQKKLVSSLVSINSKIALNKSITLDLETLAKEIYEYWFVQFDFPDENGKPYKSSGGKMVWNKELNREIPEGWSFDKIGNLLGSYPKTESIQRGDYTKGSKYPIIDQSKDFISGYTDDESKVLHIKNVIVFGDHTNFTKYINFDFARGAEGTQIINSNNDGLSNYLLYMQICALPVIEKGYSRHFKFLKEQYVLIPDKKINDEYMNIIDGCLKKHTDCIQTNKQLTELRDFLLPMLMNGQIKIDP